MSAHTDEELMKNATYDIEKRGGEYYCLDCGTSIGNKETNIVLHDMRRHDKEIT
jgi:hypothetical protein